ncbi:MAG: S1 RNA-binding domain-containing protein [Candidatus Portnoybacteria bacterium]|jgi:small subunit ribosomal protein S1|nr:S1 RNA-binding domain-containing protein [Candidatus Portnoybacteria bacterium]
MTQKIIDSPAKNDQNALFDQETKLLKPGDIVQGKILEIGKSSVFVDLGKIGTGVLLGREIKENRNLIKALQIGQDISAMVLETENEQGLVELSLQAAHREQSWDALKKLLAEKTIAKAKVISANRGGLMVSVNEMSGFLPVSQLSYEHYPRVEDGDKTKILQELNKLVGQELNVRAIDVDASEQKLIVSEKATEEEKIRQALSQYQLGDLVTGEISGVVDFGAFIKFPLKETEGSNHPETMEGLIHISEIDWQLIEDPRQHLKVGQKVTAKIISISGDRLYLSLKALKKDPWLDVEQKYQKDQMVSAAVTKINPFGAFVQLDQDIHGLVHVSEFSSFEEMGQQLKIGQRYEFKILSVEPKSHKMALAPATGKNAKENLSEPALPQDINAPSLAEGQTEEESLPKQVS